IVGGERVMLAEDATGYLINYDYGADGIIFSFGYVLEGQQMSESVTEEYSDTSEVIEEPVVEEPNDEVVDDAVSESTDGYDNVYDENGVIIAYKSAGTWSLEENSSGEETTNKVEVYMDGIAEYDTKMNVHIQYDNYSFNADNMDASWDSMDNRIYFNYIDDGNGEGGTGVIYTSETEPWFMYLYIYDTAGNNLFESELINYELFAASGNDFS
ncbi:MAG: hypothetical protein PHX08_07830, partial [Lachnospiraceae bacterium]|nr:hypothetical protein [Lachnospiraceae bacterium]